MSLQRTFIEKCPIMQQNILLHTGPGHAWKLFSAWFSVLSTMKSFRIFRAIFSDSFEDFLKVFLRKTFRKSFKTILEYSPKYSQRIHCRTTENHADNQFSQAGFRPLCNKIPLFHSPAQTTAHSPELIFHIMKSRDQTSVLLSVPQSS